MFDKKVIKAVIFDLDGTLVDTLPLWDDIYIGTLSFFTKEKIDQNDFKNHQKEYFSRKENISGYQTYREHLIKKYCIDTTIESFEEKYQEFARSFLKKLVIYRYGADKFIKLLKQEEIICVIASACEKNSLDIYNNENENIKKACKIDEHFSYIFTNEDVNYIKPHPEVFLKALDELAKLGITKDECIVIEDSLEGIKAATAAGIETINIYHRFADNDREEIEKLATYSAKNYYELISSFLNKKMIL